MSTRVIDARPKAAGSMSGWNVRTVGFGAGTAVVLALYLASAFGWRQGALFLVGAGAGVALYHAAFGFTSSWREFLTTGRGAGLRAQMLMLGVTAAVFLPLLEIGQLGDVTLRGSVSPLGTSVVAGAFLFGIGMQLGGGCASGTLFTVGGGSVRMVVTLLFFIVGSVLGALHFPAWEQTPAVGRISLHGTLGLGGGLAVTLGLLAAVWAVTVAVERRRYGSLASKPAADTRLAWLRGPWPLIAGALALAAVNIATLTLAGRPWGVTSAFALWGSKAAALIGIDVASWPYWQAAGRAQALQASVFQDVTSIMNFGIILGALTAAGLAGRFAPVFRLPLRSVLAAVLGGILLGYGARIAYGCNIGAYFSGIASSSLHGWAWFAAALVGNALGTRLRPLFGLK